MAKQALWRMWLFKSGTVVPGALYRPVTTVGKPVPVTGFHPLFCGAQMRKTPVSTR
jgi:hypothetical protein